MILAELGCGGSVDPDPPARTFPCVNPRPLDHGLEQCDGFVHRVVPFTCAPFSPPPDRTPLPGFPGVACESDLDCMDQPYGYCMSGGPGAYCAYGCETDLDCGAGLICVCGEFHGECRVASCSSDADCQPGLLCRSFIAFNSNCPGVEAFACQARADRCGTSSDCLGAEAGMVCKPDTAQAFFRCQPVICIEF